MFIPSPSANLFDGPVFIRTDTIENAAPRNHRNHGGNSIGDLIIFDLSGYQAEHGIAMQAIHQAVRTVCSQYESLR